MDQKMSRQLYQERMMKIQSCGTANIKLTRDKRAVKHVGGGADFSRNAHPGDKRAIRHVGIRISQEIRTLTMLIGGPLSPDMVL